MRQPLLHNNKPLQSIQYNNGIHTIDMETPPRVKREAPHRLEDSLNMKRRNNQSKKRARTVQTNERFIGVNKFGIPIPSKDPHVYEPSIHERVLLLEARPNGIYNFRNKATKQMKQAVDEYNWAKAAATAKSFSAKSTGQEGGGLFDWVTEKLSGKKEESNGSNTLEEVGTITIPTISNRNKTTNTTQASGMLGGKRHRKTHRSKRKVRHTRRR